MTLAKVGKAPQANADTNIVVRRMEQYDYSDVAAILQEGMDSGSATFEGQAPATWEDFSQHRIMSLAFVAEEKTPQQHRIVGWITASPVGPRAVFNGVAEDSVYVSASAAGKGVAGLLLDRLLAEAAAQGFWKLHSTIFPENSGSIRLHSSRGFVHAGTFRAMAKMQYGPYSGQWRDAYMMEKILANGPAWSEVHSPESSAADLSTQ